MKRYLVRSPSDPSQPKGPYYALSNDLIGKNSGNLFFAYSVINALTTEDTVVDTFYDRVQGSWKEQDLEYINSRYDAVILPLADAFRDDFRKKVRGMTKLVQNLKIPCVLAGVGVRADYDTDFSEAFSFDEEVRTFVKALLERSAIVGLRGERTGDYLKHLGFREDVDYTPIGCPSLYLYGDTVKSKGLGEVKSLAVNSNHLCPPAVNEFLCNTVRQAEDVYFICQQRSEYKHVFAGMESSRYAFPPEIIEQWTRENRMKFFYSVPQWLEFVAERDLFVGTRFHGSVASLLTGVPQIFIPFNSRTRELAEYHHLTCLDKETVQGSAFDYLDKLDFNSFYAHQGENLAHYVDFLEKNGLDNIFSAGLDCSRGNSPLEKKIYDLRPPEVTDYASLSPAGKLLRKTGVALSPVTKLQRKLEKNGKL